MLLLMTTYFDWSLDYEIGEDPHTVKIRTSFMPYLSHDPEIFCNDT